MNTSRSKLALAPLWLAFAAVVVAFAVATLADTGVRIDAEAVSYDAEAVDPGMETEVDNRLPDPTPAADVTHSLSHITLGHPERDSAILSSRVLIFGKPFVDVSDARSRPVAVLSQRSARVLFCTWVV